MTAINETQEFVNHCQQWQNEYGNLSINLDIELGDRIDTLEEILSYLRTSDALGVANYEHIFARVIEQLRLLRTI